MGRQRDSSIDKRVIAAAIDCYADDGWAGFNFEAVARRAGVGRPAIYLRWLTRAELLIDAFRQTSEPIRAVDLGDLREDLRHIGNEYCRTMAGSRGRAGVRLELEREAAREVHSVVAAEISMPRQRLLFAALERARRRGQIRDGVDLERVVETFFGAFLQAAWFSSDSGTPLRGGETTSIDRVTGIVDIFINGLSMDRKLPPKSRRQFD